MAEMQELAAIANGLVCSENVADNIIALAKVREGAIASIAPPVRTTTVTSVTGLATTPTSVFMDVPDLQQDVTTAEDTMLEIRTSGKYNVNGTTEIPIVTAICVDGGRQYLSPPTGVGPYDSWHCERSVLVGAGVHKVEVKFAFVDYSATGTVGAAWERRFYARQLLIEEVKR